MPQTSVLLEPAAVAAPGQLADSGYKDSITAWVESVAGVDSGRFLCEGTAPTVSNGRRPGGVNPSDATIGARVLGCVIFEALREPKSPRYSQYDVVTCLRKGRIYVLAGTGGISRYVPLFLVHTGAEAGLLTVTDDANTVAIPGVSALIAATAGNYALIDVNLPA